MTIPTGKPLLYVLALVLLLAGAGARATVTATVDRTDVALGDTLMLTLSATEDDEDLQSVDTGKLSADFEVLSRNMRSSMTIINGVQSHKRELTMEISPRHLGTLAIPAFRVGSSTTRPISIQVSKAPQADPGSETVLFSAAVDRKQVYVQGQVLLTLRVEQSINLDQPAISQLQIPDAFVVPLQQKSFQRRIKGRLWLVQEVRYAIFPEHSGTLQIPEQEFSAREGMGARSLFDPSPRGRLVHRSAGPLTVEVLPKPAAFKGGDWLPARNLDIEEEWSSDPDQLTVGESVTRTVTIRGEGLQGAQLPPVLYKPQDGVKFYPDQPEIKDNEVSTGLTGVRRDGVAIVPTRPGTLVLPAIQIPWWDSENNTRRMAKLPPRTIHVVPAAAGSGGATAAPAQTAPGQASAAPAASAPAAPLAANSNLLWQGIAAFCALGWLVTLVLLLRRPRREKPAAGRQGKDSKPRSAYRNLIAACTSGAAPQAREAIIAWADERAGETGITSLAQAGEWFGDTDLAAALDELETALYSGRGGSWDGAALRAAAERLHKDKPGSRAGSDDDSGFTLYPGS